MTDNWIEIGEIEVLAPSPGEDPEVWTRWIGFETTVTIRLGGREDVIHFIPSVQLVRSLRNAVEGARRSGRAKWEVFDSYYSYELTRAPGGVVFAPPGHFLSFDALERTVERLRAEVLAVTDASPPEIAAAARRALRPLDPARPPAAL